MSSVKEQMEDAPYQRDGWMTAFLRKCGVKIHDDGSLEGKTLKLKDGHIEPIPAFIWATQHQKNCMLGKHEAKILGVWEGVPVFEDCRLLGFRVCRHCNCVFPEKS